MRIAMIGPFGFHPNKTMHSRALGLARPFIQRGHQVILIMPPWQTPDEADRRWQEDGVEVCYVPLRGGLPGITAAMLRVLRDWRPDVVHCFKPKAYSGLVAWWLWQFQRTRLPLVVDSDDWEGWGGWNNLAPYSPVQKWFFAWQEQWGLRHNHALTVASRALQSIAWSLGVAREQVVYLPNGSGIEVDAAHHEQPVAELKQKLGVAGRPVLLLYSRLFEFATERLVTVLRAVKTAVPDLAILAVGTGLYEQDAAALRTQLQEADLLDHVVDVGWVETAVLPAILRAADIGLYLMEDTLLNRTKCPVKLADMVALGIPVVAEAVGQVSEYVQHQQTGLLVPSGDAAGMAQAIVQLLQHPVERERLAVNARAHYTAHFAWEKLAAQLEAVYVNVQR
ncbi:MAG: glycosyltransferase family 4 protein [Ardenticatenaceae bacterium]|nr:glycosyltransferase family 4 protein [Ardenticatenaceae bacterium]